MSQVLLFTPPFFRGTIVDTPSGTAYHVKPGETIVANQTDETFLLNFGFSPAAPNSIGGGNVVGPSSATDGYLAVFDGATGKLIKDGGAIPPAETFVIPISWLGGANPNASAWKAPVALKLTSIVGRLEVAEGGAATVQPVIVQSGTSISAGATLTTGAFNANGTVLADQTLALIATPTIAAGSWIGLVGTGSFTTNQGNITFTAVPNS